MKIYLFTQMHGLALFLDLQIWSCSTAEFWKGRKNKHVNTIALLMVNTVCVPKGGRIVSPPLTNVPEVYRSPL